MCWYSYKDKLNSRAYMKRTNVEQPLKQTLWVRYLHITLKFIKDDFKNDYFKMQVFSDPFFPDLDLIV